MYSPTASYLGGADLKEIIARFPQQAWNALRTLNLFPSPSSVSNELDLQHQRLSTRIFICVMIIATVVLAVYVSSANVTKTVTIDRPSLQQYTHLYSTQSATLLCPCSKISASYAQFTSIRYTMHQLCTSVFVDQFWQDFFPFSTSDIMYYRDFRLRGVHVFQSLSMFCQMTNRTVTASLARLYSSQYVTASVTSAEIFLPETQAVFDQFVASTTNELLSALRSIRDINHVNALFSGQFNNYGITPWF